MYSTKLKQRSLGRNHLIKQLHANKLLNDNDTNCDVMNKCLQEIIPLFGIKSVLSLIISNAKEHKLQNICDIISRQKRKYKDKPLSQNESQNESKVEEEAISIAKASLFSSLSKVSLTHIIDYLDKRNIERIKIMSRQFGILCLEQMNKITIGTFNMNALLQDEDPLQLDTIYNDKISCNRYNSNLKYSLLYEEWADKYNIPEQYQLIFNNLGCPTQCGIASAKQFDLHAVTDKNIKKNDFLIVDKRNVICFDGNNFKKLTQLPPNDDKSFSKILILEYFDIINQSLKTLQFIVYNRGINISMMKTYIKNKCIPIGNETNIDTVQLDLQKHLSVSPGQLIFYQHGSKGGCSKVSSSGSVHSMRVTFELNTKQITTMKNKVNECKIESEKNMIPFAMNTREFYKNNQVKTISVYPDKNTCFLPNKPTRLELKIKTKSYPSVLQNKIAKFLNSSINNGSVDAVDPKCIAILEKKYNHHYGQCFMRVVDLKKPMVFGYYSSHYFELLTFDAELFDRSVSVNIFKPSECPHPVYSKYTKELILSLRLVMIDRQKFTAQEFINYVFDSIRNIATKHILYKYYQQVLDIFDDLDSSQCVLANSMPENKVLKKMESFDVCLKDRLVSSNCNEFDLFLNGTVSIHESASILLKVKFLLTTAEHDWRVVGMDLNVKINKSDSLQEIISNYISDIDKVGVINSCVRVSNNIINIRYKYTDIQPSEFTEYKPYYEFIRNNPTDFIMFKITPKSQNENINSTSVCLPLNL